MSERRLKWDRSEVSILRELYLKNPDMAVPLLTEAFNMTTHRHRTKNAVKCQLRLVRAELEEGRWCYHPANVANQAYKGGPGIATSATSATPATLIPRNILNEVSVISYPKTLYLTAPGKFRLECARVEHLYSTPSPGGRDSTSCSLHTLSRVQSEDGRPDDSPAFSRSSQD